MTVETPPPSEVSRFCGKFDLREEDVEMVKFLSGEVFLQGFIEFKADLYGTRPRGSPF